MKKYICQLNKITDNTNIRQYAVKGNGCKIRIANFLKINKEKIKKKLTVIQTTQEKVIEISDNLN